MSLGIFAVVSLILALRFYFVFASVSGSLLYCVFFSFFERFTLSLAAVPVLCHSFPRAPRGIYCCSVRVLHLYMGGGHSSSKKGWNQTKRLGRGGGND